MPIQVYLLELKVLDRGLPRVIDMTANEEELQDLISKVCPIIISTYFNSYSIMLCFRFKMPLSKLNELYCGFQKFRVSFLTSVLNTSYISSY